MKMDPANKNGRTSNRCFSSKKSDYFVDALTINTKENLHHIYHICNLIFSVGLTR